MRAGKLARQEQVAAPGTPRDALASVLSCIRNAAGGSLVGCRASASKSLSSQQPVQAPAPASDGAGFAVETPDGTATHHVTVQTRCLLACSQTRGFADCVATQTMEVKKCFRAVTARKFSSPDWSFVLLVPELPGRPPITELKAAVRDVEDGRINGSSTHHQTAAKDAQHYPWLIHGVRALVRPTTNSKR